jgi:hypothetical protein
VLLVMRALGMPVPSAVLHPRPRPTDLDRHPHGDRGTTETGHGDHRRQAGTHADQRLVDGGRGRPRGCGSGPHEVVAGAREVEADQTRLRRVAGDPWPDDHAGGVDHDRQQRYAAASPRLGPPGVDGAGGQEDEEVGSG